MTPSPSSTAPSPSPGAPCIFGEPCPKFRRRQAYERSRLDPQLRPRLPVAGPQKQRPRPPQTFRASVAPSRQAHLRLRWQQPCERGNANQARAMMTRSLRRPCGMAVVSRLHCERAVGQEEGQPKRRVGPHGRKADQCDVKQRHHRYGSRLRAGCDNRLTTTLASPRWNIMIEPGFPEHSQCLWPDPERWLRVFRHGCGACRCG